MTSAADVASALGEVRHRERYVRTAAIRGAVQGRERDVLQSLGINWSRTSNHIRCPYPDHNDHDPSWRWDHERKVAFCSCIGTRPGEKKAHSILGVVAAKEGLDREAAKMRLAEIIGRLDLIIEGRGRKYQRTDASSLLNPVPENRDDGLVWSYLAHRLGIEPNSVPRPTTEVVGIKSLAYFDPTIRNGHGPAHVGDFPAAVFETTDRDCKRHAHRIYLGPGGAGKADLGVGPNGRRQPKKSAKKALDESTDGLAAIWGYPAKAGTEMLFEGIETAAAAALAFETEIKNGEIMIAACISASGIEAFKPWPCATRVTVGADRDDAPCNGRPPTQRGEIAARKFAAMHQLEIAVSIALPGRPGDKVDWLDVLRGDGVQAVRAGILGAAPYAPNGGSTENKSACEIADGAEISRLALLPPVAYDREREAAAERLGCRVATLDEQVKGARGEGANTSGQGRPINLPEPEPWDEGVDGAALLSELSITIRQYVILSEVQRDAAALWTVHTHAHDATDISPKLVLKSAQKRSGKTRFAEVLERLVARPLLSSGIRPAALLRLIEMHAPTLLLDEIDAAMKQGREMAEALRGIINSGFNRAAARFIMNVPIAGGGFEPRQFSTWAPQLLSGIGDLPDTVRDRSIEIEMMRKRSDEEVKRLRRRDGDDLHVLCRKSARWTNDNLENLRAAAPEIPPRLNDRAADAWEPLFAIADLAGGDWPQRARTVALTLSGDGVVEDDNVGTTLLGDIRAVFEEMNEEQIQSERLVGELAAIEEHPWAEFGKSGKPITKNALARLLKPYKIRPGTIRLAPGPKDTAKGYKRVQFADAFGRYLPEPSNQSVTPSQAHKTAAFSESGSVTPRSHVTDENAQKVSVSADCDGVTDGGPLAHDIDLCDIPVAEETWTV